jgi:hypothetical protein
VGRKLDENLDDGLMAIFKKTHLKHTLQTFMSDEDDQNICSTLSIVISM